MKLKYYQDRKGDWRWTLYARNGNVVGASSEGYKTRAKAVANFAAVTTKGPSAAVEFVEKAKKTPAKKAVKKTARVNPMTKHATPAKKRAAKKTAAAPVDDGFGDA